MPERRSPNLGNADLPRAPELTRDAIRYDGTLENGERVRVSAMQYPQGGGSPPLAFAVALSRSEGEARLSRLLTDLVMGGVACCTDLKERGLLKDTLVVWGGEFGRTPHAQGNDGRDHNNKAFSLWMAGGWVKCGHAHGLTDDYGYEAVDDKVHVHDLHATILHLLGLDHEKLTFKYAGRDFRLTDVKGNVVKQIVA